MDSDSSFLLQACVNAHAQVIMWSSWADFVSSSILLLLLAPVVGHWTDVHGRKPFIVLTCLAAAPPVLCLVLYVQYGLSLMYAPDLPCLGLLSELQPRLHLLASVRE